MTQNRFTRSVGRLCALALLGLSLISIGGCQLVGVIASKTMGATPEPAQYTPPQEPMLVLVENYHHADGMQAPSDQLALLIRNELTEHKVAPLVDPDKLYALRATDRVKYDSMQISEVGRALGAKQILYVNLEECSVKSDVGTDVYQGKLGGSVKVIDVESGETRWPQLADGYHFHCEDPLTRNTDKINYSGVRDQMLQDAAETIGKLFYISKPDYDNHSDTAE